MRNFHAGQEPPATLRVEVPSGDIADGRTLDISSELEMSCRDKVAPAARPPFSRRVPP
jgi:hypothetical protein